LLLLDEATSSLDSTSEKLVQGAIERAAGSGCTVLAVAHRLATIQGADVIFVVGGGKVLEKGRHGELLGKRGVYWQMVSSYLAFGSIVEHRTNKTYSVKHKLWIDRRFGGWRMGKG
jgi:ABC-type multidrug transport system fused ATPase/permease subunit